MARTTAILEGRVGGSEQGAGVREQELAQRAWALGARRRRNPYRPQLTSQDAQLLADELDEAVGLPDQVGAAPHQEPSCREREEEADDREPPGPADRDDGGEAPRTGVEQGAEQQAAKIRRSVPAVCQARNNPAPTARAINAACNGDRCGAVGELAGAPADG
jgi:hypothetical protein